MGKVPTSATYLECPHCGNVFTIHRRIANLKKSGHIKDLWCWKCKRVTKHIEKREFELARTINY